LELKPKNEYPQYQTHISENKTDLVSFRKVETYKRHDKVVFEIPIKLEEPSVEITEILSDEETDIPKTGEVIIYKFTLTQLSF
jgi:hypothetical protein